MRSSLPERAGALLLAAAGCTSPSPPPPPVVAEPVPSAASAAPPPGAARVASAASAPAGAASASAAPGAEALALPPGVIAQENLELSPDRGEQNPPLQKAAACAAQPPGKEGEECGWVLPSPLGFLPSEKRVAFLEQDRAGYVDPCPRIEGVVAALGGGRVVERALLQPRSPGETCEKPDQRKINAFADRLHQKGYEPATNLITARGVSTFGVWAYMPLARLGAPLGGFWLHAASTEDSPTIELALVTPDNKTRHPLGSFRVQVECTAKPCGGPQSRYFAPTIVYAAVSPDRAWLAVQLRVNNGQGHGTSARFERGVFLLPSGAVR